MSTGADNIAKVPANMVEALRIGLYIEQSAATDALRHNPVPAGGQPATDRYKRVDEARDLLDRIGHLQAITPVTVQVNLDTHRLPLLAALHSKLEADARSLASGDARDPDARIRTITAIDALGELISSIEAQGGAREDTGDQQVERQLEAQLARALDELGYDEDRGDWWRVTHDAGDGWGIKSVIDGKDRNFDITTTGYTLSSPQ
jgi:hypothetical protein